MREYRIALLTVDLNCELVENTMHGLKKYISDHENVRICIFDCFGDEYDNARSRIEYGIFELPDLSRFDGLLIQGNQIVLKSVRDRISERVKESGIPAVSIDCPIDGCVLLGLDNRRSQYDITMHVIQEHGARRLVHLTGILNNGSPSGGLRRDGFLDACRQMGLDESQQEIIECAWKAEDGTRVAAEWVEKKRPLPDAFICANDEMALAMIEYFAACGIRAPEDVIITGFDNISGASLSDPQLTTVNRDFDDAAYKAMGTVIDMIDGKTRHAIIPLAYQVICSQSCGCRAAVRYRDAVNYYYKRSRFLKKFHNRQAVFAQHLLDAADLPSLMTMVSENCDVLGCTRAWLCVNDYYFDNYDKDRFRHDTEAFGENMVIVPAAEDSGAECERFPARDLLPDRFLRQERFLVLYPIHYNTRSIGYLAMNGISEAAQMNLHRNLFSFLEIAVENVRKKGLLRYLNKMLDRLYVQDRLTGLFNRSGYERFAQSTLEMFMNRDGGAMIIFIDMDGLKMINDRYGHEAGDEAIMESARILSSVCGREDFVMRYGGDEFLVITSILKKDFDKTLLKAVDEANKNKVHAYDLGMSVGIVYADNDSGRSLDEYVQMADALMYSNKKIRKQRP